MVTAGIGNDGLGRDAFLQLLTTQMQNQNPLQPQADGEFLAQLAQFSSLEQLQAIREDMTSMIDLLKAQIPTPSNSGDI